MVLLSDNTIGDINIQVFAEQMGRNVLLTTYTKETITNTVTVTEGETETETETETVAANQSSLLVEGYLRSVTDEDDNITYFIE